MTAEHQAQTTHSAVLPANVQAARTWGAGGEKYDEISRGIADAIEHAVDALDPQPGERILDVATGTGWAARSIAARGAIVTGVDLGAEVIEAASSSALASTFASATRRPCPSPTTTSTR